MASPCVDGTYFNVDPATGVLTLEPGTMGLRQVIRYTEPGTYQFEKANYPWLARVLVEVQAPGGGSGGSRSLTGELACNPGGSGGGYSKSLVQAGQLGNAEVVTVGAPGSAGTTSSDGGDGGFTAFGAWCTANGGLGGTSVMASGTGVIGYSGIGGPLAGVGNIIAIGGGGSGGAIRLSGGTGLSGFGGSSFMGTGGTQRASDGQNAGRGFGGGAGGSYAENGTNTAGGAGQSGIVIVYLYG